MLLLWTGYFESKVFLSFFHYHAWNIGQKLAACKSEFQHILFCRFVQSIRLVQRTYGIHLHCWMVWVRALAAVHVIFLCGRLLAEEMRAASTSGLRGKLEHSPPSVQQLFWSALLSSEPRHVWLYVTALFTELNIHSRTVCEVWKYINLQILLNSACNKLLLLEISVQPYKP